jgi:RNA polymerase sigma factor (TIGR02999 family)
MEKETKALTLLLLEWKNGSQEALERIVILLYDKLHDIAVSFLRREQNANTLQPTALINEAMLRLMGSEINWQDRHHFVSVTANIMRRVLTDLSRKRLSEKRGGKFQRITLSGVQLASTTSVDMLALNEALTLLETIDPQQAKIVELMFFVGLTLEETAKVTELSVSKVNREWNTARAWLYRELTRTNVET